jgi:hypothetical protein
MKLTKVDFPTPFFPYTTLSPGFGSNQVSNPITNPRIEIKE